MSNNIARDPPFCLSSQNQILKVTYLFSWYHSFPHSKLSMLCTWSKRWIAASVANAIAVNPNGIKAFLADVLSTFFIKGNPGFSKRSKILAKNYPDCFILCNRVFNNFILADGPIAKALQSLENCALVNKNLFWKLFP